MYGIGTPYLAKLGPDGTDSPRFCMGRDCLWDSEEPQKGETEQLICSSLLYGTRLPLGQRGATKCRSVEQISCSEHQFWAPRCPRGSFVPYWIEEQISCAVYPLCYSSLSQMQSRPIQKQGASLLRGSPYEENCVCGMMYGVLAINFSPKALTKSSLPLHWLKTLGSLPMSALNSVLP